MGDEHFERAFLDSEGPKSEGDASGYKAVLVGKEWRVILTWPGRNEVTVARMIYSERFARTIAALLNLNWRSHEQLERSGLEIVEWHADARDNGVPSREEMYDILKARSVQLQRGENPDE